ncbi:TIGR04255 family protein [Vineibacter terrae]|uniref:TIGR04255 family protein n=1 Tax=Vineibacter terrae TaxID=2586908 RepID=A0A5C8P7H7_9HYPH|nr:TIGR04255 family protein [Vineibacter terrae]TXL69378.1 TIGR04255 family protein [Vineibacter terrae]
MSANAFNTARPSFTDPPVVEVVLGVQFVPLDALQIAHFGLFWEKLGREFVTTESKPSLEQMIEQPDVHGQRVTFEMIEGFPGARVWFVNADKTELLQVQADRFIFNWRQGDVKKEYPRYPRVRECFDRYFREFVAFVADLGLGTVVPNQCEVTYINQILLAEGANDWGDLSNLFQFWSGATSDDFLGTPEQVRINMAYRLERGETFVGRLHVAAEPRIRISDQRKLVQLSLTARGQPKGAVPGEVLDFFDFGREHVVRSFASLTSPAMHKIWGRNDHG